MASHAIQNTGADERIEFRWGSIIVVLGLIVAMAGLFGAFTAARSGSFGYRQFLFSYLVGYAFVLAICIGSLAVLLLQHLVKASWSVTIRRTAENFAGTIPVLAIFSLPILISVGAQDGLIYRWAIPMSKASPAAIEAANHGEAELPEETTGEARPNPIPLTRQEEMEAVIQKVAAPSDPATLTLDPLILLKRSHGLFWLNPYFFIFRIVVYLTAWSGIAWWFRKYSLLQDQTGDPKLSLKMQGRAAPALAILGITATGAAFDLLMSLDPHWYSTMFGIYFIADSFIAAYALLIIFAFIAQRFGFLTQSLNREHFQDLGKYLFAFTFFWGYVAFSQFMLIWYATIPEETIWMARHGASTVIWNGWNVVIKAIVIGHFVLPFVAIMSRHPKRFPLLLSFWAVWQLVFVAVDIYWLVMPEMGPTGPLPAGVWSSALAVAGLFGVFLAAYGAVVGRSPLRPTHDPRLPEALAFENI